MNVVSVLNKQQEIAFFIINQSIFFLFILLRMAIIHILLENVVPGN